MASRGTTIEIAPCYGTVFILRFQLQNIMKKKNNPTSSTLHISDCKPFVIFDDPGAGLGVYRCKQLAFQQWRETLNSNGHVVCRQPELHPLFGDTLGHAHTQRDVLGRLLPKVNGIWIQRGKKCVVLKLMIVLSQLSLSHT